MSYLADDTAAIKARMEEIKAEKQEALTGSSAPVTHLQHDEATGETVEYAMGWPYTATTDSSGLASLAHPEWPYAGTGFEWRKFVNQS